MKHHYEALKAYYKELQVELGKLEEKKIIKEEDDEDEDDEANTTLPENEATDDVKTSSPQDE